MKRTVGQWATLSATLLQTIVKLTVFFYWHFCTPTKPSFIGWCILVTLICRAVCSSFFVYLHVLAFRSCPHVSLGCKSNCLCREYQQVFPYRRKVCKRATVTFEWLALLRHMWRRLGSIYCSVAFHFQCLKTNTYLLTYSMEQSPSWEANWFCS